MDDIHRAISHMNDDHPDTLADYVRHYGGLDCKSGDAELVKLSTTSMTVRYGGSMSQTLVIPFRPPLSGSSELRSRLVRMAEESSISRVPRAAHPHVIGAPLLVLGIVLLGTNAHASPDMLTALPSALQSVIAASDVIANVLHLGSRVSMRITFALSIAAHIAEGVYAATLVRRAAGTRAITHSRGIYWIAQTTLYGFPSLMLLQAGLRRIAASAKDA